MKCGIRIPDSEHAVSVSLPRMQDVIGYETQQPAVIRAICSGYPRFICHWMVQRVQAFLGSQVVAVCDQLAAEHLQNRVGQQLDLISELPFGALRLPDGCSPALAQQVRHFLQHTGFRLSSRAAEDFLLQHGLLHDAVPDPEAITTEPEEYVLSYLAALYDTDARQLTLFPSGMSAFYAVFTALDAIQRPRQRTIWLQVGWLYLDTSAMLERYAAETHVFGIDEWGALETYLHDHHAAVAGITTEVMTNPLLQTADIVRLSQLCRRYNIPLLVDVSMPTPVNVDVFPYADVVIESLTKFAGGHADVMAGVAVLGADSDWAAKIQSRMMRSPPYVRDLRVLAHHMQDYRERMHGINANAALLTDYFENHPRVRAVFGARQMGSRAAYDAVRKHGGGYGGVLSVVFDKPLNAIYDRLALLKGPSFGTVFTLCMPYVYLAHYDLVSTPEGRALLHAHGVDPELLRISVGLEPAEDIIAAFDAVLNE